MDAIDTPNGLDTLLNCVEASTIFGVQAATIRKWASLGHITAAGLDERGRKLYRLGDIARYELQTRHAAGRAA